jgi:Rrf2 family nitric oxide-sensitive transcriptional repressor
MQLTLSTDIALRTLIYLGRKNDFATIQEVADANNISKTHLMKVVMALVAENFLVSERGRNGGIRLATDARNIPISSVIRLMENSIALVPCMKLESSRDDCPLQPDCRLQAVLRQAKRAFFTSLEQNSLADIL